MDLLLLRAFQRQVMFQCQIALRAHQEIRTALITQDGIAVHCGLSNLLNALASISKACWGQRGKMAEERKALRESLHIQDDSPLRETSMRNNFEHFDERIVRWFDQSARHNKVDLAVGPADMIGGVDPIDMFRHFNPENGTAIFWGEEFHVGKAINEVLRILPLVEQESRKPEWVPPQEH